MDYILRMLKLTEEILDKHLSKYRHNCPENITDLFFLEIENDEKLQREYDELVEVKGSQSLNPQLGKLIAKYWDLENLGGCTNPESNLIGFYEKHSN